MTEFDQYVLIRYGVIFIGFVMLYSAGRGLMTGMTRGYYADHVYSRTSDKASFYFWVSLRGALALISLSLGFLLS